MTGTFHDLQFCQRQCESSRAEAMDLETLDFATLDLNRDGFA